MDPTQMTPTTAVPQGAPMPSGAPMPADASQGGTSMPAQVPATGPGQSSPDSGQPVTPQQRQTLLDLIGEIRSKLTSLNAVKFASSNKTENLRRDLLKQVFDKLQMAGVDLTDRQSVADFMAKLQQNNPQLAQGFEKAMEALLTPVSGEGGFAAPQDQGDQVDLGVPPQNDMNNATPNETLPQGV